MKKMILICALVSGVYQLRAQQLFQPKLTDGLSSNLLGNYGKHPLNNYLQLLKPSQDLNTLSDNLNKFRFNSDGFPDHMPVAKLDGYSKMPVVVLEGYSKMPIAFFNPAPTVSLNAQPNTNLLLINPRKLATTF